MSHSKKISLISRLHYLKLVFRSLLFLAAAAAYVIRRVRGIPFSLNTITDRPLILGIIAAIFFAEMLLRFFPSNLESMGCQKQFAKNYIPKEPPIPHQSTWRTTLLVALVWLLLNGLIGLVYFLGWIDEGILLLICLFYSVCDMICILFFCPFQTWIMKNKCCGSCRIYNWDYAMMFTPLAFIPGPFTYGLLGAALLLLAVWEISAFLHPERFTEETNECLSCKNCKEKLCHHKTQLRGFLKKNKERLLLRGNAVIEKVKSFKKKP
ncbi:MAG: hypothetical protein IJW11_02850 [Clostridia bacterium]|nr:hypothetical protein [Clostridia bacterium]